MRILITGVNGFLGFYFVEKLLQKKMVVYATGRGDCRLPFIGNTNFKYFNLDFNELIEVKKVFKDVQPEIIVHAGAMSKPDDCEINKPEAFRTNVEGTINLLQAAEKYKCFFIFLSTDFVFDGINGMYSENDTPAPVNYYGLSKLLAEKEVMGFKSGWAIARTVLVYGKPPAGRSNILSIVKEKLEKGEEYSVVDDQFRTPTYVEDLATGIVAIIEKKATGIYHLSGIDTLTPYEMACKTAEYLGLNKNLIKKVTVASFSQPAKRPPKTGFVIDKAKKELGFAPISFEEGLKKTFA